MLLLGGLIAGGGCGGTHPANQTVVATPAAPTLSTRLRPLTYGDRYSYAAKEARSYPSTVGGNPENRSFDGTLTVSVTQSLNDKQYFSESRSLTGTDSNGAVVTGLTELDLAQDADRNVYLRAKKTTANVISPRPTTPTSTPSPVPSPLPISVEGDASVLFLTEGSETGGKRIAVTSNKTWFRRGAWPGNSTDTNNRDFSEDIEFGPDEKLHIQRAITGDTKVKVGDASYQAYIVAETRTVERNVRSGDPSSGYVASVASGSYRFVPELGAYVWLEESFTLYDSTEHITASGTRQLTMTETNVKVTP